MNPGKRGSDCHSSVIMQGEGQMPPRPTKEEALKSQTVIQMAYPYIFCIVNPQILSIIHESTDRKHDFF